MWKPYRQLRSAQWISRLNRSSKGGHDDDDDNGISLCPVGETQSQTLAFEGSRQVFPYTVEIQMNQPVAWVCGSR